MHRLLALVFAASSWSGGAYAKPAAKPSGPAERQDVGQNFKAAACDEKASGLPFASWSAGVFDAQIEGRRLETASGLPVAPDQARRKARALARVKRYEGYAAGLCDNGAAWVAAFPSALPLVAVDKDHLKVPVAALERACESWRADYASAKGGVPQKLAPKGDLIGLKGLHDGVVSITCQPQKPRWQGPVLWYLYPVGNGPAKEAPATDTMATGEAAAGLPAWVNRVRIGEGLKPVAFTKAMSEEANILTIDSSLTHNRLLLKRASDSLSGHAIHFLGENRVKGANPAASAWLLWNSPRHRALLLDKEATVAGYAQREIRGERMSVLVFGAEAPLTNVKADKVKKKSAKQ